MSASQQQSDSTQLVVVDRDSPPPQSSPPSLEIQSPVLPSMGDMEVLWKLAQKAAVSTLLKSNSQGESRVADAFFLMMYGIEIGLHPMTALRTIYVVNGTPTCSGQAMLALGKRAGFEFEIQDISTVTESATVRVRRPGSTTWREHTYTKEMAVKAGLWGAKDPWKKHTAEMLIWRAVAVAIRLEAPDVVAGLYLVDEISSTIDLDANGEPINFTQGAPTPITISRIQDQSGATSPKGTSGAAATTSPENASGKDDSAKSAAGDAVAAVHWAKTPALLEPVKTFIKKEMKGDAKAAMNMVVPGADRWGMIPLENYPTAQSFIDALKAKIKGGSGSGSAGAKEPIDPLAMEAWCQSNLNLSEQETLAQILDKSSWEDYDNIKQAQQAVLGVVAKDKFAVVSNRASYNSKDNHYIFLTCIGPILFYGHDSLKELISEDHFEREGFAGWNTRVFDEPEIIHDILIEWEPGKNGNYRVVTKITEIDTGDLPF